MFHFNRKTIAFSLAISGLAGLFANPASAAASGQIELRGSVGAVCEIIVTDLGVSLDLVNGESARVVGSVEETCNDPDGYTLSFASDNSGSMNGPLNTEVDYSFNYDSISAASLASDQSLARPGPRFGLQNDVAVNIAGQSNLPAGQYRDTITITIAAN